MIYDFKKADIDKTTKKPIEDLAEFLANQPKDKWGKIGLSEDEWECLIDYVDHPEEWQADNIDEEAFLARRKKDG